MSCTIRAAELNGSQLGQTIRVKSGDETVIEDVVWSIRHIGSAVFVRFKNVQPTRGVRLQMVNPDSFSIEHQDFVEVDLP